MQIRVSVSSVLMSVHASMPIQQATETGLYSKPPCPAGATILYKPGLLRTSCLHSVPVGAGRASTGRTAPRNPSGIRNPPLAAQVATCSYRLPCQMSGHVSMRKECTHSFRMPNDRPLGRSLYSKYKFMPDHGQPFLSLWLQHFAVKMWFWCDELYKKSLNCAFENVKKD